MGDLHACAMITLLLCAFPIYSSANTLDRNYWYKGAQEDLQRSLDRQKNINTNRAKNLVLMIGDGMGVTTTGAARVLKGQRDPNLIGADAMMTWDTFPFSGNSKTYCTNMITVDSAASGTAYHCGVKTKYYVIGLDNNVTAGDCSTTNISRVESVLDLALANGKSVGIVTTDELTGASPSAAYAHSAHRDWMTDADLPPDAKGVCKDIARQLIEDNYDIQVLLGGGRQEFLRNDQIDPEYSHKKGRRTDGKDLIQEWIKTQQSKGRKAKYVYNRAQFDQVDVTDTNYLLGMFEPERMQEETTRRESNGEPSLAEMAEKAIGILSRNPKGFYLFVEGANIDIGHHLARARYALEETLAFDAAVEMVRNKTSADDTLIVISADHSHTMSFGGYSDRGQDILGIANTSAKSSYTDDDGNLYTILSYGNGPGHYGGLKGENITAEEFKEDQLYMGNFPLEYETHGGEDVQIFASGPYAHLFTGVHEQTFIAHGMIYAAFGQHENDPTPSPVTETTPYGDAITHYGSFSLLSLMLTISSSAWF